MKRILQSNMGFVVIRENGQRDLLVFRSTKDFEKSRYQFHTTFAPESHRYRVAKQINRSSETQRAHPGFAY